MKLDSPQRSAGEQLPLLCACDKKPIAVKRLGCCRSCYDRRYHSLRFFSGLRERVLERDRFRCRGCGVSSALVVHHRAPDNQTETLITLCIRCHLRYTALQDPDIGFRVCCFAYGANCIGGSRFSFN